MTSVRTDDRRVVLVTGASRGIGRATALRFAAAGCRVGINHFGDEAAARETAEAVATLGGVATVHDADVSSVDAVAAMAAAVVEEHGGIDVLVVNAGICPFAGFFDVTEEVWDRVVDVNLKGAFFCTQTVARHMVDQGGGGSIVAVSSVSASLPSPLQPHYGPTKAGMSMLMRTLAVVLGPHGIRVNTVLPGNIRTDIYRHRFTDAEVEEMSRAGTPLGRIGEPEEVAEAIFYLAGESASYITGAEVLVDGGLMQFHGRPDDQGEGTPHGVRTSGPPSGPL